MPLHADVITDFGTQSWCWIRRIMKRRSHGLAEQKACNIDKIRRQYRLIVWSMNKSGTLLKDKNEKNGF